MSQVLPYIILDAARMDIEIIKAQELNPDFESLYNGSKYIEKRNLFYVAPFLFSFLINVEFRNWYFEKGWGDSWGVIVYSVMDLKSLVKHFRHFLMVKREDGEQLYFRFYDPRVLRVFLPTCDERQLNDFFGPVDYFICEDEDSGNGLVFSLHKGELKVDKIKKEEVVTFHPEIGKKKFWIF
jgi:hypothetical protein